MSNFCATLQAECKGPYSKLQMFGVTLLLHYAAHVGSRVQLHVGYADLVSIYNSASERMWCKTWHSTSQLHLSMYGSTLSVGHLLLEGCKGSMCGCAVPQRLYCEASAIWQGLPAHHTTT